MDIVIISFCTLVDIVIANLTHIDMVQCVSMTTTHVAIIAVQDNPQSYTKQALGDDFIPLAIETYNCFHPHFDSFMTSCVMPI